MLYAGLDLSRQRLDVHVMDEGGSTVEVTAVHPDADALRTLTTVMSRHGQPVTAVVESMNGARFIHDQLERWGWDVEVADVVRAKGLAPLSGPLSAASGFRASNLSTYKLSMLGIFPS